MRTIKELLDEYPEEEEGAYVDSGKATMVCKIISAIYEQERAQRKYYKMLSLTSELEEGSK